MCKMKRLFLSGMLILLTITVSVITSIAEVKKGENIMSVVQGKTVSIEYTLTLEDKTVVDTNVGADPLTFVQGSNQIIPGLEKEMEGLKVGDTKKVTVKPEEGYGAVNPEAKVEVKKEQVPPDALKIGAQLQGQTPEGQPYMVHVAEIKDETVILDFNHPLAGKTLHFDVKVIDIK